MSGHLDDDADDQTKEYADDSTPTDPRLSARKPARVPPREHVGVLLREWRERYPWILSSMERASRLDPHTVLSVAELVAALDDEGHRMSEAEYEAIEAGGTLPFALESLMDALARCLRLNVEEFATLLLQASYDVLARQGFDPDMLAQLFGKGDE